MLDDAFAHFKSEVKSGELEIPMFELLDDAQRVKIVIECGAICPHQLVQLAFTGVTKRRMANVVNQSESLGKFGVDAESGGYGPCDLRDFERVREAIAEMIGITGGKNLRFGLKAAKSTRVNDAVAVARVLGTIRVTGFVVAATARDFFTHCQIRKWGGIR